MAHHKIVAYRYTQREGRGKLEALTASPRGTRVPFQVVTFTTAGLDRAGLTAALEREILKMEAPAADPQ